MSELTSCNYCNMQRIKRRMKPGEYVMIKPSSFMGGVDVFVLAKGQSLPLYKEPSDELPNGCKVYQAYHRAWFGALPKRCCC